jgi:glycosyltransferase involved in cell wall biosynthesis
VRTAAFLIPAYRARDSVADVIDGLRRAWATAWERLEDSERSQWHADALCLTVDDGSGDETGARAEAAGATVLRHPQNRGKGAALLTGLRWAQERGLDSVVSVDADGQHPPEEAVRLVLLPASPQALVLGVRDLRRDGAPLPNRFSNAFSNVFLSAYGRMRLRDTQCGLRRYPVERTLQLEPRDPGYAFEAEVILRFARNGLPIVQEPISVIYPPEEERVTHFHSVRDPARIVRRVLWTVATVPVRRRPRS